MKSFKRIVALFLCALLLLTAGCSNTPANNTESTPREGTTYNIIFALATVPPVLASLDAIANGYETYALIERGKTYSGIESLEKFHNAGFDPANNLSNGFTDVEFTAMVDKVKELKDTDEKVYFNFYVQDGTALTGVGVAANAGLSADQFHIYMIEDGTGAYAALRDSYVLNKAVTADNDEMYTNYVQQVTDAKAAFDGIMAKTDNTITDLSAYNSIALAFALGALDNFTYVIQDEVFLKDAFKDASGESKLLSVFGLEGYDAKVEYHINIRYQKISDSVAKLSAEQRTDYLTLMYGEYFEATDAALTRTERADQAAPKQKLVYIGTRHGGYPKFASNEEYGIGGLANDQTVPATYEELDDKYKCAMLFPVEQDYEAFLSVLNDGDNYAAEITEEAKQLVQVATFNTYIDYIFNLKLVYALYGENYDMIMKGHPREVIGGYAEWGDRYSVTCKDESTVVYDKLLDTALVNFHKEDTTGKYIGMVPYGTSAENLAYLGADLSLCGLPSSTYTGFDTEVDVVTIIAESSQDIVGTGAETVDSQVAARYEAGNLLFTDADGKEQKTIYHNIGNIYKALSAIYTEKGETDLADKYDALFDTWLKATYPDATDIDAQGFPVK